MNVKKIDELTEVEEAFISLIYAVETQNLKYPHHPKSTGDKFVLLKLSKAKRVARKNGLPLSPVDR